MSAVVYSGADLAAVIREAAVTALKESMGMDDNYKVMVANRHFEVALKKIKPSVTEQQMKQYLKMKERMCTAL